jgi:hypothetical protein
MTNLHLILCKSSIEILKIDSEIALSNGAIWNEFSKQR